MTNCGNCGEPIVLDEHGIWHHHTADGAVVCGFGLDTDYPGRLCAQVASPTPRTLPNRR